MGKAERRRRKQLSDTLAGGHATRACNSNAAAAVIDSWLSSKTIRAHVANELPSDDC